MDQNPYIVFTVLLNLPFYVFPYSYAGGKLEETGLRLYYKILSYEICCLHSRKAAVKQLARNGHVTAYIPSERKYRSELHS